ncbi:M20 peptidase aminoacylase family protein [Cytobacillus gottheilii]|uniref:M20 peptidase aminoacylase family protein n=1 Tax=Cytobacillus gottheilii TaxID=859144 RepID=UPI0009BB66E4|nr:M20 peptidase aminoacylase family protein [Cytobacillus gottheilii]
MKKELESLKDEIKELYQHLHEHPEISWQEVETTKFISAYLQDRGYQVSNFKEHTGLIMEVGSGNTCIAVRTDIDALWQEVDGVFKANHSCGHDAHMTMVIGVFLLLEKLEKLNNNDIKLKFIFQPAEEKGTGALKMIEHGVLDDVDYLYGVHLRPIQELRDGFAAGAILHGASMFLNGEINGIDAHAARPHLGQNAIEVAAAIVNEINNIHINPLVPYSAKMTKLHAGGDSANIIPGRASFTIDLRAQTNEMMEQLKAKINMILEGISLIHNVKINSQICATMPAATKNSEAIELMEKAIAASIGKEKLIQPIVTTGGEDFHHYTKSRPHLKATMLGLGCDLQPGLHHPHMNFNEESMFTGIEILARTILHTIERVQTC